MLQRRQCLTLIAACWAVFSTASAASLIEVYERARISDPQIREADALRLANREALPQSRSALLPQIDFNYTYQEQDQDGSSSFLQVNQETLETTPVPRDFNEDSDTETWRLELRQSVFRWDRWVQYRRSEKVAAQAEIDYSAAQQDLMLRVSARYFNVLAAKDTLDSAEAALESTARQLEQAEKRFEVGLIAITDVQEAQAAYDNTVAAVIAAKRDLATAAEFLREITGESYAELQQPGDDLPLAIPLPADEDAWVDRSLEQNLTLLSSRVNLDIASDDIKIQRTGYYPTIDLVASTGNFDQTTDGDSTTVFPGAGSITSPTDSDADVDTDSIQLQLNVPLFQGGRVRSNVREAVYRQRAAKERLERVMRETERESRDAYLSLMAEISRVKALRRAVESSQTALEATEAGFEVGTRTTVDVLDARRRLFESETNYARSKYDYIVNIIRLKQAAGILSPRDLMEVDGWLNQSVATR
jgi:outer membrane protein